MFTARSELNLYIQPRVGLVFRGLLRLNKGRLSKKVSEWSPAQTRSLGRPKNRWEDDVKSDITKMEITKWKECIRDRTKWKKLVEMAKISLKL